MSDMFKCNKCGNALVVEAIVGETVETKMNKDYSPFAVCLGCPDCGIIVNSRLLVVEQGE